MNEKWKDIDDWPGYEVSDFGRVRRGCRIKDTDHDRKGYLRVKLWRNNKAKNRLVHRLVAVAFIGPIPVGMYCCHNNGDKTDNAPGKLRYDSANGNEADKLLHGTAGVGEKHPASKLTSDQVLAIRARYVLYCRKNGSKAISREYGVTPTAILSLVNGKTRGSVS